MAYHIEVQGDRDAGVYLEIALSDISTGDPIRGFDVDHRLVAQSSDLAPGEWSGGQIIASNADGRITSPETGVQIINIPPSALAYPLVRDYGQSTSRQQSVRCKLLAVPSSSDFTRKLADVIISFGGLPMASPRVQVKVYPYYPVMPGDPPFSSGTTQVSQIKIQLAAMNQYDAVEAALGGPTSEATIAWTSGGTVTLGGPLSDVVAGVLGYNSTQMATFLLICSQIVT